MARASTAYTTTGTYHYSTGDSNSDYGIKSPPTPPVSEIPRRSALGVALAETKLIKGFVSVVTFRESPIANDAFSISFASTSSTQMHVYDPTNPPQKGESKSIIGSCDYSIVAYILEHMTDIMDRANVIKTALLSLKTDQSYPYVILATRTRKHVHKFAKAQEYEKVDNYYIVPNESDKGATIIQGIDGEELEMLAIYAGANNTCIIKELKVEGMTCVAASFRKKTITL